VDTENYEVYVNAEAIIEICRGPHMTVAQAFGEDWQASPAVHLHPAALAPCMPVVMREPERTPPPAFKPPKPDKTFFYFCVAILAWLCAWAILRSGH